MDTTKKTGTSMFLRMYGITLTPADPSRFSLSALRTALSHACAEYRAAHDDNRPPGTILSRYPPILCGQHGPALRITGLCQGADVLWQIVDHKPEILDGTLRCHVDTRDAEIRCEPFGITDEEHEYEFITPWRALNQQNGKKFYLLQGKPSRDAFMQKLLTAQLNTLAKSLEYAPDRPITSSARVRFIRERIDRQTVMIFKGTFRTNLEIPQYLGIGQYVSQGSGWVQEIPPEAETS